MAPIKDKQKKKYTSLRASLELYCNQLIVLSFNGQKYDVPLIKRYLLSSLSRLDSIPDRAIKKERAYMALSTPKLKFLDVINYLGAGTSLDAFYRAY